MDTKLYLTIGAVAAILYALAFLLFPVNARRAQRSNCQRCRPCDQHHHNRLGNCDRLAQWACLGLDGCARFVVGWGSLPARRPQARR